MQETRHPNRLRELLALAGLTQREVAHEADIAEGTLRHYVNGEQVIPRRDRIKLARVIGCDVQDLAPRYNYSGESSKKWGSKHILTDERAKGSAALEEWDGCFSFGKLKTTSMVLDRDGIEAYLPGNIRTHYDPQRC